MSSLKLNDCLYNSRYRILLKKDPHPTNYGMNKPLNDTRRIFNESSDIFEFGRSRDGKDQ
jgi:hypothetical protein